MQIRRHLQQLSSSQPFPPSPAARQHRSVFCDYLRKAHADLSHCGPLGSFLRPAVRHQLPQFVREVCARDLFSTWAPAAAQLNHSGGAREVTRPQPGEWGVAGVDLEDEDAKGVDVRLSGAK